MNPCFIDNQIWLSELQYLMYSQETDETFKKAIRNIPSNFCLKMMLRNRKARMPTWNVPESIPVFLIEKRSGDSLEEILEESTVPIPETSGSPATTETSADTSTDWIGVLVGSIVRNFPTGDPVCNKVFRSFPYANICVPANIHGYSLGTAHFSQPKPRVGSKSFILPSAKEHKYVVSLICRIEENTSRQDLFDTETNRIQWLEASLSKLIGKIQSITFFSEQFLEDEKSVCLRFGETNGIGVFFANADTLPSDADPNVDHTVVPPLQIRSRKRDGSDTEVIENLLYFILPFQFNSMQRWKILRAVKSNKEVLNELRELSLDKQHEYLQKIITQ